VSCLLKLKLLVFFSNKKTNRILFYLYRKLEAIVKGVYLQWFVREGYQHHYLAKLNLTSISISKDFLKAEWEGVGGSGDNFLFIFMQILVMLSTMPFSMILTMWWVILLFKMERFYLYLLKLQVLSVFSDVLKSAH